MRNGALFVIRRVITDNTTTTVIGLMITGMAHGVEVPIIINKKVSSFREAVEEMKKSGY